MSLQTGEAVARALEALDHHVIRVDPVPGALVIPPDVEVAFLALHGVYGEDGQIQSELEQLGIPYTGCGVEASRLAFDKVASKQRFLELKIPTAPFTVVENAGGALPGTISLPFVLKPVEQGSSVGLQYVDAPGDWEEALKRAMEHGDQILVEERVVGREVTVAVLAGVPLPIVEIEPVGGRYDYESKYVSKETRYLCPAPFTREETQRIQQVGLKSFLAIGGRDYGRVDIIVREGGEPVVLEVNTLPGMTSRSLFPKAAAAAGINYEQLCQRMIDLALEHQPCAA